jgi:hypothetical protein
LDYALNKLWRHSSVRRPDDNPEKGKPHSRSDKKKGGWGAKRKMGKQHLRGTPVFFNLLRIHPSSLVSRLSTLFFFFSFLRNPFHFRAGFPPLSVYANEKKRENARAKVDADADCRMRVSPLNSRPHRADK